MASIDYASAPEEQGWVTSDADRGGPKHSSWRRRGKTAAEGQNSSQLVRTQFADLADQFRRRPSFCCGRDL